MNLSTVCFILGGIASLLLAALHLVLVFRPQGWRYFGADALTTLAEQGSRWIAPVTFALVVLFAVWGMYALAGAGVISPLPWLKTVLIVITIIYILRGLLLLSDLIKVIARTRSIRFAVFSMGSLVTGLLYLTGTVGLNAL